MADATSDDLLALTGGIVASLVSNKTVHASEVPALIANVHAALSGLGTPAAEPQPEKPQGKVTARKSLANPAHILSMIDGKPYKMLTRHVARHGHTPASYRETYGLPRDYPMISANYAEARRALAHKIGLGRKQKAVAAAATPTPAAKRGRKPRALGAAIKAARGHLGGG